MRKYSNLIDQTFDFPTEEFSVVKGALNFHEIPLNEIIEEHGTPLRISYLPRIRQNIQKSNSWFNNSIKKHGYNGSYTYCYCTKSSHFKFVLDQVISQGAQIETSSSYDIQIVKSLFKNGEIKKDLLIVCNGFKRPLYTQYISELINDGFENCIPILDNLNELAIYESAIKVPYQVGIRIAAEEEPNFEFYTSRLGVRYKDVNDLYTEQIVPSNAKLKMLHFFINTGIRDTAYYWSELSKFVYKYCELKNLSPELDTIDIGGGFPIKTSLNYTFDYQQITDKIIETIKWICDKNKVPVPHIITEFGSFTVGESGAHIYSILDQKLQNDKELWYMIDGSFITHLPDTWGTNQKYILLPLNKWNDQYHKVNIGGLTCDSLDYYNSEAHSSEVFLPKIETDEKLYIGFFHTGAYQEALGGTGGIQHCLIPAAKHILMDLNESGDLVTEVFSEEQSHEGMLKTLGY